MPCKWRANLNLLPERFKEPQGCILSAVRGKIFSVISCLSLFLKIRKPRPQRERAQWDIGIAHAEKALKMTREERIEQYTFIYIDKEPEEVLSKAKKTAASKAETKKSRRAKPALSAPPEHGSAAAASPSSAEARRQSQRRQSSVEEEEPPPVKIAWKTAAARKSLPASITMHNLDLQKCNMSPVVKIEQVFALQNAAGDGKLIDQFVYSTKVRTWCSDSCSGVFPANGWQQSVAKHVRLNWSSERTETQV